MRFPQFRKYKNNLSFFEIKSSEHFVEWKKQPVGWEKIEFVAKILPDRVFVSDMLEENSQYWDVITELEYVAFLKEM